jgi:hypothetical protein
MTTCIKLKWDAVFNAAVIKEHASKKAVDPSGAVEQSYSREYEMYHVANIKRAKALQRISIYASKGYDDNTDYVYLSIDDYQFLFELNDEQIPMYPYDS